MILTVPNSWHWRKVLRFNFRLRLEKDFSSEHIRYFSARTLRELLEEQGFAIDSFSRLDVRRSHSSGIHGRLRRIYSALPYCARTFMITATDSRDAAVTPSEQAEDDAVQFLAFLSDIGARQRFRFASGDSGNVAEAVYRIGASALKDAPTKGFDLGRTAQMVMFWLLIDAALADLSPEYRAELRREKETDLLASMSAMLPRAVAVSATALWGKLRDSSEYAAVWGLFDAERFRLNAIGLARDEAVTSPGGG